MRVLPISSRMSFSKIQPLRSAEGTKKEELRVDTKKVLGIDEEGSEAIKKKEEQLKEARANQALSVKPHKRQKENENKNAEKSECLVAEVLKEKVDGCIIG